MKIRFLGGVGTVTGSMYLVRTNRHNILLECGLYQGKRQEAYKRNHKFSLDIRRLNAVVLSHAHIDHSGNLPNLVNQGYDGPIYCTHATRELCAAMLPDSGRIQEQDIIYANKQRKRQNLPLMDPLYTEAEALDSLRYFVSVGYNRPVKIARDIYVTFLDAGHILGSAMILLETKEHGRLIRLLFTGDLGQPGLPIVRDPVPMPPTDVLMIESTYGNREHPPIQDTRRQLETIVNRVVERGGRIIIPAFAIGRTQDIVYDLHQLSYEQRIPDIPIYVDSPLATNVTEIFRLHPECYDHETHNFLTQSGDMDPFGFYRLQYTHSIEESKWLNDAPNPLIIISASGMAEAGRVQHHLKHAISDPQNAVLITGWQAPYTLGRRIADYANGQHLPGNETYVRIFGEEFPLRAEVYTLYGYSAHADCQDLLAWARPYASSVKATFVVHGDSAPANALAKKLQDVGYRQVCVPQRGDKFSI
ncbi:MAG: MBL fold metallo-hydrolase [Anaerolineae bacterium]|nr:MBL fold metallo-hydrolase [Anaerolineae bacterium]